MSYERCPQCKQFNHAPCRCEPYQVKYPELFGDDTETYYGQSFDDIVERVAEEINEDEPVFDRELFKPYIEITDKNGVTKRFNCMASVSVDYFASEIDTDEEKQ